MTGIGRWATAATLCLLGVSATAQAPPDIDILLARVGERIADYYKRAQSVVCTEKTTVQPVGHDYAPVGFARVTVIVSVEADNDPEALRPGRARAVAGQRQAATRRD
jgi:hypothetical protein